MARKVLTIEVSEAHEPLLRQYLAFLGEMDHLADTAADGSVLDVCEQAVLSGGKDLQRQVLARAIQRRLAAAEKRGRRSGAARAGEPRRTAGPGAATC
jgi:hypothetical protein